jgi:hypothetical protein
MNEQNPWLLIFKFSTHARAVLILSTNIWSRLDSSSFLISYNDFFKQY